MFVEIYEWMCTPVHGDANREEQVLQQTYKIFGCLATNSLLQDTWQFLGEHRIEIQHDITAPLRRYGDKCLMVEFSRHGATKKVMKQLN